MRKGEVVALHQEGLNHLKERLRVNDKNLSVEERLSRIEESIDRAIALVSQGCIGLLAAGFPDVCQKMMPRLDSTFY